MRKPQRPEGILSNRRTQTIEHAVARSTPESFEKRQRERRKRQRREEKVERRLIRNEEKRRAKAEREGEPARGNDTDDSVGDACPER